MKTKIFRIGFVVAVLAALAMLAGCAATYTGLRYKDLQVQNKMSASIFLEPVSPAQRTVFVQVRNTSDKPFQLQGDVIAALTARGYKVVDDPNQAHYMLQANVLSVGEADKSAVENAQTAGFGGVLGGAAIGGLLGGDRAVEGAVIGGLAGAAAETISGALVKVVTYMVITDLQISERSKGGVSEQFNSNLKQGTGDTTISQRTASSAQWKKYQTRIVSTARQTNLTFQEAYLPLRQGIAQAIGGMM
ncbi:complement resistance protein TraT [Dethiosulfatarculus sandiegensis]|uniref:Conjugal transfer protein TraT n=1 Tax=Dethiosulfatarculus sandiegensis TaxID=1429043 RepID=A0A0D2JFN5_9BACT|nr:complement resistance protein TraT [Dethiosulfatarculus sandiegensis]KIX14496.1 conjugal transfer protein TraT [Dethiosulfatarculus sandiegensis]